MLDERREIRDKRCFELSSRTSFRDHLWKSSWRPVGSIGSIVVLFALAFLSACTDYVAQIEDRYGEWETSSVTPQSSSSMTRVSGSSLVKSSSSSSVSATYVDPSTVVKGVMTDIRDGQTYKTVTIGTQTWMTENLNYAYTGVPYNNDGYTSDSSSWCYGNDASNCTKYGRLYTWAAAMDSVGTWSMNGKGCGYGQECNLASAGSATLVRGVCPEGWHLPTKAEFEILFTAVGGRSTAGKRLKSKSGWSVGGNGMDAYAFSALPAGSRSDYENYVGEGGDAFFWSSTEGNSYYAYWMYLDYGFDDVRLNVTDKIYGFSVRCVKD